MSFYNLKVRGVLLVLFVMQLANASVTSAAHYMSITSPRVEKIASSNPSTLSLFGESIALSDDLLVVASPQAYVNSSIGAAYVYRRTSSGWNFEARLTPSDRQTATGSMSIATDGSTIVLGFPHMLLLGSDGANIYPGSMHGAAYVFNKSSSGWSQTQRLIADVPRHQGYFGGSPAVNGDTLMMTGNDGINVFRLSAGTWSKESELVVPGFTGDIEIDGNSALIGAGSGSGTVYSFEYTEQSGWQRKQILRPDQPLFNGQFGHSVSMSGNTAIIGQTPGGPSASGPIQGSAYIFEKDINGVWSKSATLQAGDGFPGDAFGFQVAMADHFAAATSRQGNLTGQVHLFEKIGNSWHEQTTLVSPHAFSTDQFGIDIALNNRNLIIGARLDNSFRIQGGAAYSLVIPEPASAALILSALLPLLCRRPRR